MYFTGISQHNQFKMECNILNKKLFANKTLVPLPEKKGETQLTTDFFQNWQWQSKSKSSKQK